MKRVAVIVAGLVAAAGSLLSTAPAQATTYGTSCPLWQCSTTVNQSSASVYVARNWCWESGTTASSTTADPYCSDVSADRRWIRAGDRTPPGEDWDTFRVDAGYCYRVHFLEHEWWGSHSWDVTYNQSGNGDLWVKVENNALAYVRAQAYGYCP